MAGSSPALRVPVGLPMQVVGRSFTTAGANTQLPERRFANPDLHCRGRTRFARLVQYRWAFTASPAIRWVLRRASAAHGPGVNN